MPNKTAVTCGFVAVVSIVLVFLHHGDLRFDMEGSSVLVISSFV